MPKFHSHPQKEIIENFKNGLNAGYKNFALIAGDIGCYGVDIGTSLPKLLEELFKVEGDYKIALIDLNVQWLLKYYSELLTILKSNSEKISTVILPIQSGSDKILNLMNRHYAIDDVKRCISDLKKSIPEILIETHVVVGFPGETTDDFSKSIQLVKEIQFSKVLVYKYEERPGTLAVNLPKKVPKDQIDKRAKILKLEIARTPRGLTHSWSLFFKLFSFRRVQLAHLNDSSKNLMDTYKTTNEKTSDLIAD
jgi:tRNA A37 methylthiotransferase MiaB